MFGWEDVAQAFSSWVNDGGFTGLRHLYGGPPGPGSDNGYAVYLAVQHHAVTGA